MSLEPAESAAPAADSTPFESALASHLSDADPAVKARILEWARRLLDLSRRNRLLWYKATKRTTLVLRQPNPDAIALKLLEGGRWSVYEPPRIPEGTTSPPDLTDLLKRKPPAAREVVVEESKAEELTRTLETINRRWKSEYDDRGIHTLHLVWGLLHWTDPGSELAWSAPLVLIPVELARSARGEAFELRPTDDDARLNPALRVKLENDYGATLPDIDFEEIDLTGVLDQVRIASEGKVPDGWRLEPYAAVGLFSFAKEPMYRDLVENAELIQKHPAVRSLATGALVTEILPQIQVEVPSEENLDSAQPPAETYAVVDADSSQRLAIEAATRGQSFVLIGPPGTGKSQTIANVIAELVARGKSVLFVSQKAAALDVVASRLGAVDLRDVLLELHSAKASRSQVATELGRVLGERATIHDGSFPAVSRAVTDGRARLNGYASAVHEVREPLGRSVYQVLGDIEGLIQAPALPAGPVDHRTADSSHLERTAADASRLADVWDPVDRAEHFLWTGARLSAFNAVDQERVLDVLKAATMDLSRLADAESAVAVAVKLPLPSSATERQDLRRVGELVCDPRSVPEEWLTEDDLAPLRGLIDHWDEVVGRRAELARQLTSSYGEQWEALPPTMHVELDGFARDATKLVGADVGVRPIADLEMAAVASSASVSDLERMTPLVARLRSATGMRSTGDGLAEVEILLQVARITQQKNRPPAAWLARARAVDAKQFLLEWGGKYEEAQTQRRNLVEAYDQDLLKLDLEPVLARMERFHGRWWNLIRPSYRADRRLLASLSRTRTLKLSALDDLRTAVSLHQKEQILASAEREAASVLGPYAHGLETDVGAAQEALDAAFQLIELPHESTDWGTLSRVAAYETGFDADIDRTADELELALRQVHSDLGAILEVCGPNRVAETESMTRDELSRHLRLSHDVLVAVVRLARESERMRSTPYATLRACLEEAETKATVDRVDHEIAGAEGELQSRLHSGWQGLSTDWADLRDGLRWSVELRRIYGGRNLSHGLARQIATRASAALPWTPYGSALDSAQAAAERIVDLFEQPQSEGVSLRLNGLTADAIRLLGDLIADIDKLSTWVQHRNAKAVLLNAGWGEFTDAAAARTTKRADLAPAIRRAWLSRWLDAVIGDDDRLSGFGGEEQRRAVTAFADADQKLIRLGRERVLRQYEERKPVSVTLDGGEQALIRREAAKRRKHVPVRTLLGSLPTMLPLIKPCLMMSPLSVSHFLTPGVTFDVIVFDEASQVPPEDAINCIYRGRQLIVAGDPNQLPPTDFFQKAASADNEADLEIQVDDFESVLDLAHASNYPLRRLRWHYRSQHDSLIAFSNAFIYGNSLVTFPPPYRAGEELGVQFIYVEDGVFDRGRSAKNLVEARRVVDEMVSQLRREPDLSVGVVAFSVAQQEAIQDEWDRRARTNPDLDSWAAGDRLSSLFIKNLETVQGDERDVIIFSIGYGRDVSGRLLMNFGPLNREGGWRRLNVAVTRARRKVIVVSSIKADDFRIAGDVALPAQAQRGPKLLRDYLAYAERGELPASEADNASRGPFESDFESEVAKAVQALGYEAIPQVGVSTYRVDIGIVSRVRPSRFSLGIECDGASYHSAKTARDRDRLREQVLRSLGWRIHRVWSQDWYVHRALALAKIKEAIEAAEADEATFTPTARAVRDKPTFSADSPPSEPATESQEPDVPRERNARETLDLTDSFEATKHPWTIVYKVAKIPPYRSSYHEFHEAGRTREHAERISELVHQEGPVHEEVVAQRLASAFGLQRVGARMSGAIYEAVRVAERSGGVRRRGPFIWPAALKELLYVRLPDIATPETSRNMDEIPPEEVDLACLRVTETAVAINDGDLRIAVARVFGFSRTGDLIGSVIGNRIEQLAKAGRLASSDGSWKLGAPLPAVTPQDVADGDEFQIGDWVRHPKFGVGRIVAIKGGVLTLQYGNQRKQVEPVAAGIVRASKPR